MNDPIIDELLDQAAQYGDFEDGDVEYQGPYGVGKWPNAVLMDVAPYERTQYGYRVGLVFNLKGEDGMKYTGRLDLPRTIEENGDSAKHERAIKATEITRNFLATVLHAGGLLPEGKKYVNVDNEDRYERLVSLFRSGCGKPLPIEVKVQRRKNKDTGKWEDTDFTTFVGLKPRK